MYFEDEEPIKVFRTTIKTVIKNLSALENIPVSEFQEAVENAFAGYDYEDQDEVVGFENWPNLQVEGEYDLQVKVDHEHAYEFSIHIISKNDLISISNVL